MIIKFKDFLFEKMDIRNDIDLQKEYDDINKRCFNNELENVPLVWIKSKKVGGRTHATYYPVLKTYKVDRIEISYFYELDYDKLKNILAHEMIHTYMFQKNIKEYGGSHGIRFKEWMEKLNKMEFNINISDDAEFFKISNENELGKPLVVVLIKDEKNSNINYSIALFQENFITDETNDWLLRMFKRNNIYSYMKYYITIIKSKDSRLRKFKVKRTASTFETYAINEQFYNELMEQGDVLYDTVLIE
jgi:predicted SprT family Zn-dependent metalloprotease